jgi:hypothetical protein
LDKLADVDFLYCSDASSLEVYIMEMCSSAELILSSSDVDFYGNSEKTSSSVYGREGVAGPPN